MPSWLLALIAGAVLTWLVAYAGRVALVKREVEANDRALGVLDDHLMTWVEDDPVRLRRELRDISETLNKEGNLFWSGHHGQQIAQAKERALQAYRDQERTARSQEAEIRARETQRHSLYRAWKKRPFGLTATERVKPTLDVWAAPVTRHLADPEHDDSPGSRRSEGANRRVHPLRPDERSEGADLTGTLWDRSRSADPHLGRIARLGDGGGHSGRP